MLDSLRLAILISLIAMTAIAAPAITVVDGDTVRIEGQRMRLTSASGAIDAPESGERARCPLELYRAQAAKDRLQAIVSAGVEVIDTGERDRWSRPIIIMRQAGRDVGDQIVREGHAKRWASLRTRDRPTWCGP